MLSAGVARAIVMPGVLGWREAEGRETSAREMKGGPERAFEDSETGGR